MISCENSVEWWLGTQARCTEKKLQMILFLRLQSGFFLRDNDQQVAVGVGEDLVQLDWHRAVRVDSGGAAGSDQPRLRLSCAALQGGCDQQYSGW